MAILIWSGIGILVPIVMFLGALIANLLTDIITGGSSDYWHAYKWPLGIAFICAGIIYWLLDQYIIRTEKPRVLTDKETGKDVILRNRH